MQHLAALLLQARLHRFEVRGHEPAAVDDERGQTLLDHRDGAVLEIRNRPRTREHVARFAELQRDLLSGRKVEAPAEHDGARAHQSRDEAFQLGFAIEGARDGLGRRFQRGLERRVWTHRLGEAGRRQQAPGVGFWGWDADLGTRLQREHELRGSSKLGARIVRDRERQRALAPCLLDDRDHVRRFTRLRDADHRLAIQTRRARVVGEQGGRGKRDEVLVAHAEEVFCVQRRVVRAAARGDHKPPRRGLPNARSDGASCFGATGEQSRRHLRLLGDLGSEPAGSGRHGRRASASTTLRSPPAASNLRRASSGFRPRRSMTMATFTFPRAASRAPTASSRDAAPRSATTPAARPRCFSLEATTPTILPRWVWARRVKTAVLNMFRITFWTVPAFSRVEPAITSGPLSTSIAISAAWPSGEPGLHVTAIRSGPSTAARSNAPRTKGVLPLALIPTTTSPEPMAARRAVSPPRSRSSSCVSSTE